MPKDSLRSIPSIDSLLDEAKKDPRCSAFSRALLLRTARQMVADYRKANKK